MRSVLAALFGLSISHAAHADYDRHAIDGYGSQVVSVSRGIHIRGRHKPYRDDRRETRSLYANHGGLIRVETAAGSVFVAPTFAPKITGFIDDVVSRGFRGPVHCYASGGHVSGSLHYSGNACDFAQRGWGKTVSLMYHVADLAAKWGLRDGCTFRDCGHIDSGARLARASHHHHHRIRYATAR